MRRPDPDTGTGEGARIALRRANALAAFLLLAVQCSKAPPGKPAAAEGQAAPAAPPPGLEYVPPEPGTYRLPPIGPASDGTVLDEENRRRQLHEFMGDRYVLLSFVYTRCSLPRGCPLATGVLQMVRGEMGKDPELARALRLVTISFDPERDTPAVMEKYAGSLGAHAGPAGDWVFLTTPSAAQLDPILEGYGQSIVPERDATGRWTGDFSHVLKAFLIDREGRVRQIYSSSYLHPVIVINDVRTLLMEDAGG